MKCWSRSTLGVIFGIANILVFIACTIYVIWILVEEINNKQVKIISLFNMLLAATLLACIIMAFISILLVAGIIKKRHKLMLPWLILSCINFAISCGKIIQLIVNSFIMGCGFATLLTVVGFLEIGTFALILWHMCTLYRDISAKQVQRPGHLNCPSNGQPNNTNS